MLIISNVGSRFEQRNVIGKPRTDRKTEPKREREKERKREKTIFVCETGRIGGYAALVVKLSNHKLFIGLSSYWCF